MATIRAFAASTLSALVIAAGARESGASYGAGLMATAAGMTMIPFAVEAGCAILEKRKPQVADTMDGIMGSLVMGIVPAVIVTGLVYSVSSK